MWERYEGSRKTKCLFGSGQKGICWFEGRGVSGVRADGIVGGYLRECWSLRINVSLVVIEGFKCWAAFVCRRMWAATI